MPSRRSPSMRDKMKRLDRAIQTMIPGTGGNAGRTLLVGLPATAVTRPVPVPVGGGTESVSTVAAAGTALTLVDVSVATLHYVTLSAASCALTFPAAAAGESFTLVLGQDGTGSRGVTWPASVKWAGGTAPTLTTTAAKRDVLSFLCADGSTWLAFVAGKNYS